MISRSKCNQGELDPLWKEPFSVAIPPGTTPGVHRLAVKVVDTAGGGGIWKPVTLVSWK